MKKFRLILFFQVLFYCSSFAQGAGNDAIIKYFSFSSQLDQKSDTLHRKYYYKYGIDVPKDEMVLIKYISPDYAVSIYVRGEKKDTLGSVEIPKYFSDKGSRLVYLFKPSQTGHYDLLFTSKDSVETGKFTFHLAYFNAGTTPYDDSWEFCQRIDYILQHSATDFQFITGPKTKDFNLTNTRTTDYYLETPSQCEIEYFTNDIYVCTILEKMNLEKCIQKLKELDYEMKKVY